MEKTIRDLLDGGKQVVFIIDNPEFDFDPRLNVQRPLLDAKSAGFVVGAVERSRNALINLGSCAWFCEVR